jgi:transposase
MGKSHSMDLRKRVYGGIETEGSARAAARRFGVSASTGVRLAQRMARTGSLEPGRQGRPAGGGKLAAWRDRLSGWSKWNRTSPCLNWLRNCRRTVALQSTPARCRVCCARRAILTKNGADSDRGHPPGGGYETAGRASAALREQAHKLVFIDETATATNMTRQRGRAPKGKRLRAHAPFGNRNTRTFIAALRHDGLTAPWVINGAMNRDLFEAYVETQLAPTLEPGDVVILDNLSSHKSEKAKAIVKERGAWFVFLPPYSPDLNPIELAFSKLKAHLRRIKARTIDDLVRAVGDICSLYTPEECMNYFKHAGYASD